MLGQKKVSQILAIAAALVAVGSPDVGLAQSGQPGNVGPANVGNVSSEDFGDAFVAAAIGIGGVRGNDGQVQVEAVRAMAKGTGRVSKKSQVVIPPSIFDEPPRLFIIDGPVKLLPLARESNADKLMREAEEAFHESLEKNSLEWTKKSSAPLGKQAQIAIARDATAMAGASATDTRGH